MYVSCLWCIGLDSYISKNLWLFLKIFESRLKIFNLIHVFSIQLNSNTKNGHKNSIDSSKGNELIELNIFAENKLQNNSQNTLNRQGLLRISCSLKATLKKASLIRVKNASWV